MSKALGTAIVTGASGGIGAVYADRLAKRGYDLILVARNSERLHAVAEAVRSATGRRIEVIVSDLSQTAAIRDLSNRIKTDRSVSFLVNNAGTTVAQGILGASPEATDVLITVNITAPTHLAVAAFNAFLQRKAGAIVNISSVRAVAPETTDPGYASSKSYILNLALSLAARVGDSGVKVQAVLPGPTRTDMWDQSPAKSIVPPEMVMEAGDLVDAAMVGLDQGEVVTIPPLQDRGLFLAYDRARVAMHPHLANGQAAERYRAVQAAE